MAGKGIKSGSGPSTFGNFGHNTGSGLADLAVSVEMKKLLECPVCLEIPLPPIFQCQTGHTICNLCKVHVKECPSCKSTEMETRNFAVESILEASTFFCHHRHNGCEVSARLDQLQQHHSECVFRPITCHLARIDGCKDAQLDMRNYAQHLLDIHQMTVTNSVEGKSNLFETNNTTSFDAWIDGRLENPEAIYTWDGHLLNFDGNAFVTLIRNRGPMFHYGFFLIGENNDAAKYTVRITTFDHESDGDYAPKYVVIIPVSSIRSFLGGEQLNKLPNSVVIHKEFLDRVGHITPTLLPEPSQHENEQELCEPDFQWTVRYEITKVQ